jgi:hypothetical protein
MLLGLPTFAESATPCSLPFFPLLFLRCCSYEALIELWARHGIAKEVAAQRSISDRVIRANWY